MRLSVLHVMSEISKAKEITLAEGMAPSNKTRIAVLVVVTESPAAVFDGFVNFRHGALDAVLKVGWVHTISNGSDHSCFKY